MAKIILVTGANRGIGKAIADGLEDRGCRVIRTARNRKQNLEDGWLTLDVTDPASIERAAEAFAERFDHLDVLINNAAVLPDSDYSMESLPASVLMEAIEVNVAGVLRVTNQWLPMLRNANDPHVINMSSRAGQLSDPIQVAPAYCVSKSALNGLTVQQSLAFASYGIRVNAMSPGWVRTAMGGDQAPLTPEQGADTAIWLALDAEKEANGQFWSERQAITW